MWEPEILKAEDDPTLITIGAPFDMPADSRSLVGRSLLVRGIPHRIEAVGTDASLGKNVVSQGERITLRVRPLPSASG